MFPDIFDYLQLHLRDGKFYRLGVQENTIGLLYQNVLDIFSFYDKAADSFLSHGKTGQLIIIRADRLEHLAIGELDGMFPPYKGYPMPLMVVERISRDRSGRIQDYTVFYIANFKVGGNTVCHRYVITGMKNGISAVK